MRMFQSVSGHNSEQSIAHYSPRPTVSRPTVSRPKGISDTISNWFENHQPQRTQISTATNARFIRRISAVSNSIKRIKFDRNSTSESTAAFLPHVRLVLPHYPTEMQHRFIWSVIRVKIRMQIMLRCFVSYSATLINYVRMFDRIMFRSFELCSEVWIYYRILLNRL